MNLEHHRKRARRLLREYATGDPDAVARATGALGSRAGERFLLSDAQHVIAREEGFHSWPELKRAADDRTETTRESGLRYAPGEPVLVTVVRRERRLSVHDSGAALEKAGMPHGWRAVAEQLERSLDVNVSRGGVVWLPVVAAGPGLTQIAERIAAASLALYQDVLEIGS